MNQDKQQEAEVLYKKALDCYLGVETERNLIKAKTLLLQSAEMGLSKACNLLGDWFSKGILPDDRHKAAFEMYTSGCRLGDSRSFSRLAMCYKKGLGVERNLTEALRLYIKSAELGNAEACFDVALLYANGKGVEKSQEEAFRWYEKGALLGDADCACNLAFCYFNGNGTPQNTEKAKELFLQNADFSFLVQRNLGVIFYKGTTQNKPDVPQAVAWFTKAAENGDAVSMRHLGKIFWKTDKKLALEWFRKGAEADGGKGAYFYAFRLYQLGEEHWNESFRWMKRAAENRNLDAQFMLGLFYKCEVGTPVDHANAFYWFKLAAEGGYEQAYSHVGRYFRDGRIVKEDYKQALYWFEKAIHSKNKNVRSEALYDYGMMHLDGLGVKKDRGVAEDFLRRSSLLDCLNAQNKLKELNGGVEPTKTEESSNASIKKNGNILEYVGAFLPAAREKLNIYIACAVNEGLILQTADERLQWLLTNKDFAQWVIDVSDDLQLYDEVLNENGRVRKYWALRFSRLFLSKKGKQFKAEDIRHYLSEINGMRNEKDVRNIDLLLKVHDKSVDEIKKRGLR